MSNIEKVEKLIKLYGNDVLRIANSYIKDTIVSEDIFQDVFIKVLTKLDSFRNESEERTWLIRITINTCKDYLKNSWQKKVLLFDDNFEQSSNESIEAPLLESENNSHLIKEILRLPIKYREVILLYYYQDFSSKEISQILKIPEASVRTRMKRAREILKQKFEIALED